MAENKTSFVLYSDQRTLIDLLTNEQAGILLKHIFAYVNDENPINTDQLINVVFEPIKQQFKRDLKKWEATKEGRSKAGLASAEARRINKLQQTSTNVNKLQQTSTNPTVNDNVNVNVNVNDIKEVLSVRKVNFSESLKPFLEKYSKDMLNEFYLYWTEHGEKDRKMKFEKQKSFGISQRLATWNRNNFKPIQQSKIDNPYNLSPAQLESNRISKLQLDEAIRLKNLSNDSK
jgi:hypothetical protein